MSSQLAPPSPDDLGPAMQALDERGRAWVRARVWEGLNPTKAAAAAGYSQKTHGYLRVQGHRLSRRADIIAALREEGDRLLGAAAPLAISGLVRSLDSKNAKTLKWAVDSVLDRTGYARRTEQAIRVEHRRESRSYDEILSAVADRLRAHNLVALPAPVDGEFTVVKHVDTSETVCLTQEDEEAVGGAEAVPAEQAAQGD